MFARPRPKKSPLPPLKKRKTTHTIEEISFDKDAREDYLTGFRKRKQARIKRAQDQAAEREKEEKRESRKHVRRHPIRNTIHPLFAFYYGWRGYHRLLRFGINR